MRLVTIYYSDGVIRAGENTGALKAPPPVISDNAAQIWNTKEVWWMSKFLGRDENWKKQSVALQET